MNTNVWGHPSAWAESTLNKRSSKETVRRVTAGLEAERMVGNILASTGLVSDIVYGVNLGPGIGDVDIIAIGEFGVAIFEVKAGSGPLSVNQGGIIAGDRKIPGDPVAQVLKQLSALTIGEQSISITPIVVVANSDSSAFTFENNVIITGGLGINKLLKEKSIKNKNSNIVSVEEIVKASEFYLLHKIKEISDKIKEQNEWAVKFGEWADVQAARAKSLKGSDKKESNKRFKSYRNSEAGCKQNVLTNTKYKRKFLSAIKYNKEIFASINKTT